MSQALTEIAIRSFKGSDSYRTYWDSTPGFGVRVGKRTKTYVVVRGRNRERVSLGRFGDISLADARAQAKRLLSTAPEPKDAPLTFSKAREQFLDEHYRSKRPSTKREISRILNKHFTSLETMQLAAIEDTDIKAALDPLADRPSEHLHAFRAVRTFTRWCTRSPRRYIKHSPMEGYEAPCRAGKRSRVLTDDELKAVWTASDRPVTSIFRLLILWGTRRGETAVLEQSWLTGDGLTIPGSATKNYRDHSIPILPLAQTVLDTLPKTNSAHLFPSQDGAGAMNPNSVAKLTREVQKLSGTSGWTPHDLRRTFRSNMARLKVPRDICELLINHAPTALDDVYDRYSYLEEKRDALGRYEALMLRLLAQA